MRGNDEADREHEVKRKRLGISWDAYWRRLAAERVGSEEDQVRDVLAQLREGGYENRIRADTIERLIKRPNM